jgi:hypothetical protein
LDWQIMSFMPSFTSIFLHACEQFPVLAIFSNAS